MESKTFTEKLVALLINGGIPSAQGSKAKESGLIIALSDNTAPVCATYGSAVKTSMAIAAIISQSESIRAALVAAVAIYSELILTTRR